MQRLDKKIVDDVLRNIHREYVGDINGVRTGIGALDNIIGYLHNGGLYVIFGRPGIGKTDFAFNMVYQNSVINNNTVVYEMSDPSLNAEVFIRRLAKIMTGIGTCNPTRLSDQDKKKLEVAVDALQHKYIFMDTPLRGEVFDEIKISAEQFCLDSFAGIYPDYVVIDDFEHIEISSYPGQERWDLSMKRLTSKLKKLAVDINRPVIVLAEASSGCELRADRRPVLSDLTYKSLSYDFLSYEADCILSLYREDYYDHDALPGIMEINVLTNLYGDTGRVMTGIMPGIGGYVDVDSW